jgi:hypothetical protein
VSKQSGVKNESIISLHRVISQANKACEMARRRQISKMAWRIGCKIINRRNIGFISKRSSA